MSVQAFDPYLIPLCRELFKQLINKIPGKRPCSHLCKTCILKLAFSIRSHVEIANKATSLITILILVQHYRVLLNSLVGAGEGVSNPNLAGDDEVHFWGLLVLLVDYLAFVENTGLEAEGDLLQESGVFVFERVEELTVIMKHISKQILHRRGQRLHILILRRYITQSILLPIILKILLQLPYKFLRKLLAMSKVL